METISIGIGTKPLSEAEEELIAIDAFYEQARRTTFCDNFSRIFSDIDAINNLIRSQTIQGMRLLEDRFAEIDGHRDIFYLSEGFSVGTRITFHLYHTIRLIRHPGYKATKTSPYQLPTDFEPQPPGTTNFETENKSFNELQNIIVSRVRSPQSTEDQEVVFDFGIDFGTNFMTECLAQRQRELALDFLLTELLEEHAHPNPAPLSSLSRPPRQ